MVVQHNMQAMNANRMLNITTVPIGNNSLYIIFDSFLNNFNYKLFRKTILQIIPTR